MKNTPVYQITCLLLTALLILPPIASAAPPDMSAYTARFSKLATARSETLAIMGGDDGATGGTYRFYDDGTRMTITKLGGKGAIGKPRPIGETGLAWKPQLGANVGYIRGENSYLDNPVLLGNTEKFSTIALGLEAGPLIRFTDEIRAGSTLGLIYAHSDSRFESGTEMGARLKQFYSGQLFDWDIDTISLVPALEIQYEKDFDKQWKLMLLSRFAWFSTWSVASSSDYLRGSGSSFNWETKADVDVRLPLKLSGFPMRAGAYVSVDMLGNDFRDTVGTNAMYTFNGRLVLGDLEGLWKLDWVGLAASYIKADTFYGYSVGLDAKLKF